MKVGTESQRTHQDKIDSGFYAKYMSGKGLDIGYAGYTSGAQPILPGAIGVDLNYPGYDGKTLPFGNETQDYIYSSHCLEHIRPIDYTILEWFRVLKTSGYMILVLPHQYLYEKKQALPSKWNEDHKEFYTPGKLLSWIEDILEPNHYRVRLLEDGDKGFDYSIGPDRHSDGQYEITLAIQKITPPTWTLA